MNLDAPRARERPRRGQLWLPAILVVLVAAGLGVVLMHLLAAPPSNELRELAGYLLVAGAITLLGGWLLIGVAEHQLGLSIRAKAFLAVTIGSVVALLNVFIVARLMFVSTSHDLQLLASLLVFGGVVTAFFSLWLATRLTERVTGVAEAIRALAGGEYERRLMLDGGDEVAELAAAVDGLADRLQESERQRARLDQERRELTAAISHDLRTPLASVRAMAEALSDGVVEDEEEAQRYYDAMGREIERLSRMFDDLFELARMDAGALELDRQPVSLDEIAAEVVDAMQAQAAREQIELTLRVEDAPPRLPLDGARIERALSNLVRNALDHTPPHGSVEVVLGRDGSVAVLRVADDGAGIPSEHLPRIWERFYRGESSRRRSDAGNGAGLGLAIVRGIAEAHGGDVGVESAPGRGTTFTIRIPLAGAPS